MKSPLRNLIHQVLSNNIKSIPNFTLKYYFDFFKNSLTKLFNIPITCAVPFISTLENHRSAPLLIKGFSTIPSA
jgi:hypothetical protein